MGFGVVMDVFSRTTLAIGPLMIYLSTMLAEAMEVFMTLVSTMSVRLRCFDSFSGSFLGSGGRNLDAIG